MEVQLFNLSDEELVLETATILVNAESGNEEAMTKQTVYLTECNRRNANLSQYATQMAYQYAGGLVPW